MIASAGSVLTSARLIAEPLHQAFAAGQHSARPSALALPPEPVAESAAEVPPVRAAGRLGRASFDGPFIFLPRAVLLRHKLRRAIFRPQPGRRTLCRLHLLRL